MEAVVFQRVNGLKLLQDMPGRKRSLERSAEVLLTAEFIQFSAD
jgi:hypothetical protein